MIIDSRSSSGRPSAVVEPGVLPLRQRALRSGGVPGGPELADRAERPARSPRRGRERPSATDSLAVQVHDSAGQRVRRSRYLPQRPAGQAVIRASIERRRSVRDMGLIAQEWSSTLAVDCSVLSISLMYSAIRLVPSGRSVAGRPACCSGVMRGIARPRRKGGGALVVVGGT